MKTFSKESLIDELRAIRQQGWISSGRHGNAGGVGNTLEDLLGIQENNLPIPNAAEWELKTQRGHTTSLTTLFHMEPSPRVMKWVPRILLPLYGWAHQEAGARHPATEMSFRQTIDASRRSDRGFQVVIDRNEKKVLISFDPASVAPHHAAWLSSIEARLRPTGRHFGELDPQPYWGFNDLFHKAGAKLHNVFYVRADVRKIDGREHFHYNQFYILQEFDLEGLLTALELGHAKVDFDARTGHNHGTKFRLMQSALPELYKQVLEITDTSVVPVSKFKAAGLSPL